jgi:hypothetical protein
MWCLHAVSAHVVPSRCVSPCGAFTLWRSHAFPDCLPAHLLTWRLKFSAVACVQAGAAAPSIIFLDELDGLVPPRSVR